MNHFDEAVAKNERAKEHYVQECAILADMFKDYRFGTVLDIGAAEGVIWSNSKQFIERGWHAVLVEPNPENFIQVRSLWKDNPNVECILAAVLPTAGLVQFLDAGAHTSTCRKDNRIEYYIRGNYVVSAVTPTDLKAFCKHTFDLVSIDTEGMDNEILAASGALLDGTKAVIAESFIPNADDDDACNKARFGELNEIMKGFGFSFYSHHGNLIYVR